MRFFPAIVSFLLALGPAQATQSDIEVRRLCLEYLVNWQADYPDAIRALKFSKIDKSIVMHSRERRGFISAPIDYSRPELGSLSLFFRLIPTLGSHHADKSKPIIVVFNGGPGLPSSIYRKIDYDYEQQPEDRLSHLTRDFRVLLIDQRGTEGYSSSLDLSDPSLRPEIIARYFDADEHAKDAARVIDQMVAPVDNFYILAQSYGGHIGFQYLLQNEARIPDGMIMASAAYPGVSAEEKTVARRSEQLRLQTHLLRVIPGIDKKLLRLRSHLEQHALSPQLVHSLWMKIGWGKTGEWEPIFEKEVDRLLTLGGVDLSKAIEDKSGSVHFLNYVLSSSALSPGYTDNTLTEFGVRQVPFAPWMLDEAVTLRMAGAGVPWQLPVIAAIDKNPPPATYFAQTEEIKAAISRTQVLFTFGEGDAFLPTRFSIPASERFRVPGHTLSVNLPGGHPAIWSAEGLESILRWIKSSR